MKLSWHQRTIVILDVMIMHFVAVACLVENIFAFANMAIMVLERKEDALVSNLHQSY